MPPERVRWVVWMAMVGALALYAALATLLPPLSVPELPEQALLALGAAGIGIGASALVIHRVALVRPFLDGTLDPKSAEGAARALRVWIVCWALAESVGLLGLVASLVSGRRDLAWPAVTLSMMLLVAMSPRLPTRTLTAAELNRSDVRIGEHP